MRRVKVGELIVDYNVYPRTTVDKVHISYLKEAEAAGHSIPPIVIDAKSKRIGDGVHRHHMYLSLYGPEHEIEVIERRYRSEAEFLADAIRMNAAHGKMLTRCDRVHCMLLAEQVNLSIDETAKALSMTVETLTELRLGRVATTLTIPGQTGEPVALKRTIRHMAGRELTAAQVAANDKLSGMNAMFYVNQIILLIDHGLLDLTDVELITRLRHLAGLIGQLKVAA